MIYSENNVNLIKFFWPRFIWQLIMAARAVGSGGHGVGAFELLGEV